MVDGSTRVGAFVRILHSWAPGLVTTSLFAFIQAWNEYLFGLRAAHEPGESDRDCLARCYKRSGDGGWGPLMQGATLHRAARNLLLPAQ